MVAARLFVVFPAGLICHKMAGIGAPDGLCTDRKADRDPVIVHAGRVYPVSYTHLTLPTKA